MLDAQFLQILRCPIDPTRETNLILEEDVRLLCSGCRVQFPIKDGFPNFVIDEAILPEGCPKIDKLPCRKKD